MENGGLYGKMLDEIQQQQTRIQELMQEKKDLLRQIDELKSANEKLFRDKIESENMLAYERNKCATQLKMKDEGIVRHLAERLEPELDSIWETVQYVDESYGMRISRRLDRIDRVLKKLESDAGIRS